jgi:putative glutamine amidotransferase
VIGITTGEVLASYGVWKEKAVLLPADYVRSVERAHGIPVTFSPVADVAETLVGRVDGIILTGGADVDPSLFGEEAHPKTQRPDPARDAFELALLDAAVAADLPVLAICRGIQVVNVWRGGTLHQHLPDVVFNRDHMEVPGTFGTHRVRIDGASRLGAIVGSEESDVPTHHHQAVARLGTGLTATAWAEDGTIEAVEDPSLRFLIAVQWHPEMGEDQSIFEALVAACQPAGVPSR